MPASSEADEDEREGGQDEDDINEETENEINRQIQVFIHKFIKYKVKIHPITSASIKNVRCYRF